jgi:hypothetical protein
VTVAGRDRRLLPALLSKADTVLDHLADHADAEQ